MAKVVDVGAELIRENSMLRAEVEALRAERDERLAQVLYTRTERDEGWKRAEQAEARLAEVVTNLDEKLDILTRRMCFPDFDCEDVAIILRDVRAAAQPKEEPR